MYAEYVYMYTPSCQYIRYTLQITNKLSLLTFWISFPNIEVKVVLQILNSRMVLLLFPPPGHRCGRKNKTRLTGLPFSLFTELSVHQFHRVLKLYSSSYVSLMWEGRFVEYRNCEEMFVAKSEFSLFHILV